VTAGRFERAIAAIDAANAEDPNEVVVDGVARPKELVHAELMTEWVQRLDPGATDAQLLAARAHHLRRWAIPRPSYPDGRAGYLRWRTALKHRHAADVAAILDAEGYDEDMVERVQQLIRKDGLAHDPQVQTHEDALCLVFLQLQLDELVARLGDDKTVDVLRKTLVKMSQQGIDAALALPLTAAQRGLLAAAGP
jgi:hypothetical protein